jgi:sec-independent protein translocase protein TatB
MFDFSFSEILLCFIVALVVLGPERMPGVARTVGRWTGKARVYMRNLSAELERESQVAELKKQIEDAQRILREQSQSFKDEAGKLAGETHKLVEEAKPSLTADASKPPAGNG